MAKIQDSDAVQFAQKGGKARAKKLTAEERKRDCPEGSSGALGETKGKSFPATQRRKVLASQGSQMGGYNVGLLSLRRVLLSRYRGATRICAGRAIESSKTRTKPNETMAASGRSSTKILPESQFFDRVPVKCPPRSSV